MLVSDGVEDDRRLPVNLSCRHPPSLPSSQAEACPSSFPKSVFDGSQVVRRFLHEQHVLPPAQDLIVNSWRASTRQRYESQLAKWQRYCVARDIDPVLPNLNHILNYLAFLFDSGLSYSSVNLAKSALCSVISLPGVENLSSHPLLKRLMRGVFNSRPTVPRYSYTWDVGLVLTYLRSLGATVGLSLKSLTLKLTSLLVLLSHSRVHYIHSLSVSSMDLQDTHCTFFPTKLLKHSRPTFSGEPLRFYSYGADPLLCVISTLKEYLRRRALLASSDQLLLTHRKPHRPAHRDTIARWLKSVMQSAGIDTSTFHAHSFRSAASSKAYAASIPIDAILRHGQWHTEKTWVQHYKRLLPAGVDMDYAAKILE